MLLARNVVGNQDDWANYVTLSDEHETPALRRLAKGSKPVNVLYDYQADTYSTPQNTAHVDGKDWDNFKSAGENRVALKSRVQWFDNTAAVSKLGQDVTNAAGVKDELAREIPKKLTEMAREMECAFCGDTAAYEDDGATGNKTQGMGIWIQSGTTSQLYQTPASVRPPAASIYTGTKADLTEDAIKAVLESAWRQTGRKGSLLGLVGTSLKKRFSDFQFYIPSSISTQSTSRVSNRDAGSKMIGEVIDVYDSEWGKLELHLTPWNAHANFGGSSGKSDWRGYFTHPDMWELRWNQKPAVYRPEFKGGSYKAAMDAIIMLVCKNPIGEMAVKPSDA